MKRIMTIENKSSGLDGPGRIGWVEFSRSMRSLYYRGKRFEKTKSGYKYNCYDAETGDDYWISGPKQNGRDKLYGGVVEIDEDARVACWPEIRKKPGLAHFRKYRDYSDSSPIQFTTLLSRQNSEIRCTHTRSRRCGSATEQSFLQDLLQLS